MLSLGLPQHPCQHCTCCVVIGLAISSLEYLHWHWARWLSLGFVWVKGKEQGLAAVVKGNATILYLMGLPQHGSPLAFP